jgi:multidrug efflux system outer membrane protein
MSSTCSVGAQPERRSLQEYFATEEGVAARQISLVASVANAYLTWQADKELLKLTRTPSVPSRRAQAHRRSNEVGVASALDLAQSRTSVENARAQLAYTARSPGRKQPGAAARHRHPGQPARRQTAV